MYSNRRKIGAWCLIVLAAAAWAFGVVCLRYRAEVVSGQIEHTLPMPTSMLNEMGEPLPYTPPELPVQTSPGSEKGAHILGYILCGAAFAMAAVGVFLLYRVQPLQAMGLWIALPLAAVLWLPMGPIAVALGLCSLAGFLCLWRYGRALGRLLEQLPKLEENRPIAANPGPFAREEAILAATQARQAEAVRTAVTSERFKVELISNVSHDLRTPLTSILGYGELLEKQELSPEGREQLGKLNQKAGYMRDLVESLFELTKVSSGAVQPQMAELDLIRLLEQTIGLLDDRLKAVDLQVRRHYCAGKMPLVTDGARMHQVFVNLLGNAIKYALPGSRIHLEVAQEQDWCRVRMVNISNYEMDFQPEEILQRFARGDRARITQGSGIGLAIAQSYTQSVGGSFAVAIDGEQFIATVVLPKTDRNL